MSPRSQAGARRCGVWSRLIAVAALVGAVAGCGEPEQANTVTVERTTTVTDKRRPTTSSPRAASGYVKCDANIRAKAPNTTCAFAQNVFWAYWTLDRKRSISVWSPAAKASFTTTCEEGRDEVVCTTPSDAEVRFSLAALDSYSQEHADRYAASHDLGPDPYEPLSTDPPPSSSNRANDDCEPGYSPCLEAGAGDYDCEGGAGDGPNYTGPVTVTGSDPFDLDRDGDGTGCD